MEHKPLEVEWTEITTEISRTYTFPGGDTVTIHDPIQLNVSASGGHRILDAKLISHYIPPKWIHLSWSSLPGQPNFVA